MMLHLRPDLVRPSEVEDTRSLGEELEELLVRLRIEGAVSFSWLAEDLSRLGLSGDARQADASKGKLLVAYYGEALADAIRDARAFPLERLG